MALHSLYCADVPLRNCSLTHYDIRKYSFTARVVNIWNSLLDVVVKSDSIDIFKSKLVKFWKFGTVRQLSMII